MKKIQTGICPDSIHPDNGRAVFVYCNNLMQNDVKGKKNKPKYAIEFGSFFPHVKAEIEKGVFAVSEGHTDQLSFYGEDMYPNCFQTSEEVLLYAKYKVAELENQLLEAQETDPSQPNSRITYISIKITLAAWKRFVEQFQQALEENRVDSFTDKIQD